MRRLVVVDVESSGLSAADIAVEVAWRDVDSGEHGSFVPKHDVEWVLRKGDPDALTMNGYRERLAEAAQDDGTEAVRLYAALRDQALAGSNPGFDAGHLERVFRNASYRAYRDAGWGSTVGVARWPTPWHHRLPDVSNYAAGALGIDPRDLPGLARVCELLGVEQPDHTAAGDVRAAADCFAELARLLTDPRGMALARHQQGPRPDGTWGCLCGWPQDRPHAEHVREMLAAVPS